MTTPLWTDTLHTPLGTLRLLATDDAICAAVFDDGGDRPPALFSGHAKVAPIRAASVGTDAVKEWPNPLGATAKLQAYFEGQLDALETIPVNPGGTAFQQQVWRALQTIPAGTMLSYRALATRLGNPEASRAVGSANARNPIAIIIPCHRIIGANGNLTGYAWGTERKRWLLHHEGVAIAPSDGDQMTLPVS